MKRKSVKASRPSPNEEAQLVREEQQRRRKLRLQQVREQERSIALQVRREVQERREGELRSLGAALRDEWQRQKGERIQTLEKLYKENLRAVGQGHRDAKENEPDWNVAALIKEQNDTRATERHQKALRSLITQRQAEAEQRNRHVEARKKALMLEKERAASIASLPHSAPDPIESVTVKTPLQPKTANMQHYSITHHHVPETAVDREADTVQPDAQEAAESEARRLEELEREESRDRQEQLERARLRGDHALRKEKGIQDNARLLCELERLQQAELQRRRRVVNSVPARIFQPLYRHDDLRAEQQRELENAFQDLCTEGQEIRNDLVLQLVSKPLPPPVPSAKTDSTPESDLDVTLEPNETPCEEDERDAGQEPVASQSSSVPAEGTGRMALRRLLNRIRTQRGQWSGREPPEGHGEDRVENTDNKHGSPSNLEWQQASSLEEGTVDTLVENNSKTSEDSIVAERTLEPDQPSVEMDPRLREEELNRQQVEQLALLQELEENRRSLELQLEEAKLHRHRLQDALEVPSGICTSQESPTSPLQEMVSEPSPEETVSTSLSDNMHKQRLHQYQQRLLKQNSLHQKTIDEARRSLEEYKRTLKTRYAPVAMTAAETLPPSEAVYALPSVPPGTTRSTAIMHLLNTDTESGIPGETAADNTILAGPAFLIQPPLPSHGPALATHPNTHVTTQPISVPVGIAHSVHEDNVAMTPQPAASSSLGTTLSGGTSAEQDVPLLPPAVFLEYLRNRRSRAPLAHPPPTSQQGAKEPGVVPQEKGKNNDPPWDARTEENQQVRERIQKQKDALHALLGARRVKDQSLSLDDGAVMDAPVKERSNEPLMVSTTSTPSRANGSASAEHSLWESTSDGRVNPPVSCPPRTLQILLHGFEQHKLSTIEEVDTPVNVTMDTAAEVLMESPSTGISDHSCSLSLTLPTKGSESSPGPSSGSEVSTRRPSKLSWREMLQMDSAASHAATDSSEKLQQEQELELVLPPDGASGGPDFLSSTTLSTGTYFSSEHEPNLNITDNSLFSNEFPARPGTSLTCSSSSNSLQHIIAKYTKELDTSLQTVHTGGSVYEVTASESGSSSLSVGSDVGALKAAQPPTLPLQCIMEDSNSLNTTMQYTFRSLSPEITNNDMTERSPAFQLPLNPSVEKSSTNTTASDWLDCGPSQDVSATDGQSSFASAGVPQWEWTLGNSSELRTLETSVSHDGEDFSLQNVGEVVISTLPEKNKTDGSQSTNRKPWRN